MPLPPVFYAYAGASVVFQVSGGLSNSLSLALHTVAVRRSVAPGINVRPAALVPQIRPLVDTVYSKHLLTYLLTYLLTPCPRSQPTTKCGELPSCVTGNPGRR